MQDLGSTSNPLPPMEITSTPDYIENICVWSFHGLINNSRYTGSYSTMPKCVLYYIGTALYEPSSVQHTMHMEGLESQPVLTLDLLEQSYQSMQVASSSIPPQMVGTIGSQVSNMNIKDVENNDLDIEYCENAVMLEQLPKGLQLTNDEKRVYRILLDDTRLFKGNNKMHVDWCNFRKRFIELGRFAVTNAQRANRSAHQTVLLC